MFSADRGLSLSSGRGYRLRPQDTMTAFQVAMSHVDAACMVEPGSSKCSRPVSQLGLPRMVRAEFPASAPLLPPALHGRRDAQRLAVLGDGAPRDVDACRLEQLDDGVVRKDVVGALLIDHLPDAMTHGFR